MDYLADIKKYSAQANEAVVAKMARTYALALQKQDSRTVSFSDPAELERVRTNYVKKKLGVADSDESIDAAIKKVGAGIHGQKNRLTVYYLLAEHYGKLSVFGG
ncbi:DUF2853 family protein [Aestuariimicrobium kwangyangense]|uniref:DUF2853 family protein n=1 Tax=Aestuariimicrobium kwangyangense TaxID=396389 RepID=UPI0003B42671|nr:DUF2853 family protein [Aestuariimicrobium kwangyangense]